MSWANSLSTIDFLIIYGIINQDLFAKNRMNSGKLTTRIRLIKLTMKQSWISWLLALLITTIANSSQTQRLQKQKSTSLTKANWKRMTKNQIQTQTLQPQNLRTQILQSCQIQRRTASRIAPTAIQCFILKISASSRTTQINWRNDDGRKSLKLNISRINIKRNNSSLLHHQIHLSTQSQIWM